MVSSAPVVRASHDHGTMQTLTYAEVLSKLIGMLGEQFDVGISGTNGTPPMFASWEGELTRGMDAYGSELVGWHPDTLLVYVGHVQLTLHPDQFAGAQWAEDAHPARYSFRWDE
jgi:hypothetical protein